MRGRSILSDRSIDCNYVVASEAGACEDVSRAASCSWDRSSTALRDCAIEKRSSINLDDVILEAEPLRSVYG